MSKAPEASSTDGFPTPASPTLPSIPQFPQWLVPILGISITLGLVLALLVYRATFSPRQSDSPVRSASVSHRSDEMQLLTSSLTFSSAVATPVTPGFPPSRLPCSSDSTLPMGWDLNTLDGLHLRRRQGSIESADRVSLTSPSSHLRSLDTGSTTENRNWNNRKLLSGRFRDLVWSVAVMITDWTADTASGEDLIFPISEKEKTTSEFEF